MTNKQEFERKLATLRKFFNRRCLFCEQVIENDYFLQTLLPIPTCEFCFNKYEVLKEGKELGTISELFPNICYFCREVAQREEEIYTIPRVPLNIIDEKIKWISHCPSCAARYKLLGELENEQKKIQQQI
ncbi:hypothetical protein Glove_242g62 [Diversispora epigaea]|uniref:Uncharacterized protein n=1 Tax=Diversispora epigaea TaxID=1348612 RepID=A0A397IE19_9GLOM|nr:hypothetical protein Glove_242g62 [Diversispora epigaea]